MVNRGAFTRSPGPKRSSAWTGGRSLISHFAYRRVSGFDELPVDLRSGTKDSGEHALRGVLTPWDLGIRYSTDTVNDTALKSPATPRLRPSADASPVLPGYSV